jgi:hypothetical protein
MILILGVFDRFQLMVSKYKVLLESCACNSVSLIFAPELEGILEDTKIIMPKSVNE